MKTGRKTTGWSRRSLARLAYDTAGNTMLIMAAAMFPIIGMAGSAFDMSRAYMVKSRLQQACDAGALAGRRAMTAASFDNDATAKQQANSYFNFNYPAGSFSTTGISFTPRGTSDGQVTATATATMPMVLMRIFGIPTMTLNVNCDARLEIANNDIMFVLDVTGSMAQSVNGEVKIEALRDAVNAFYDELAQNSSTTARIRYGFVPFSAGINVGQILLDAGRADFIADARNYQTRLANYTTPEDHPTDGPDSTPVVEIYPSSISKDDCGKYGTDQDFSGFNGNADANGEILLSGGPPPATERRRQYSNNNSNGADWGWSGAADTSGNSKSCRRRYVEYERTYQRRYRFTNWSWGVSPFDTSQYKRGNSILLANNTGGSVETAGPYNIQELVAKATVPTVAGVALTTTTSPAWNRCIEERKTVTNFASNPGEAHDLNIDEIPDPDDADTLWGPTWQRVVYYRNSSSRPSTICPAAARRLAVMTATEVSNYVNSLQPTGNTYLDYGMIWGARLISPTGIFGADNLTAPNGRQINRHVVFMTDGMLEPNGDLYSMYGHEPLDRRITGTSTQTGNALNSELRQLHLQRFVTVCKALHSRNITVWTIAFATGQEPEMVSCATDQNHALVATSTADLRLRFKEIASRIAQLRLSK